MSVERSFFDTNVLIYANDTAAPEKQLRARALVGEAIRSGSGCLSTQVLAEFWVNVTKKLQVPLSRNDARRQIALFEALFLVPVDRTVFLRALELQQRYQLSFWDAQILSAAKACGCVRVYSEDLEHGAVYDGIAVVNPFR
ncbi:MAG: PIN domain-containing protein [Spirochaetales bacterium]